MNKKDTNFSNRVLNFRGYEMLSEFEEKELKKIITEDELVKFEL